MVHRLHDTRLLENLVKSEKEYSAALFSLLVLSHSAISTLSAYGAASTPTISRAILGVASALSGADEAFGTYASSLDDWRDKLKEIKRLEGEIETIMRDREILVTRLLKMSKQKPTKEAVRAPQPPNNVSRENVLTTSKLVLAQSELQACEVHLAEKQRELDHITQSAVKDGLEKRCRALVECGNVWSERGREGLRALEDLIGKVPQANGNSYPYPHPLPAPVPRPFSPGSGLESTTSLAPSQSASQIGVKQAPIAPENPHPGPDHPPSHGLSPSQQIVILNSPTSAVPHTSSPLRETFSPEPRQDVGHDKRLSASYRLDVAPAHSIDDHAIPSGTMETFVDSSSDEGHGPLEIHENKPFTAPVSENPSQSIPQPTEGTVEQAEKANPEATGPSQPQPPIPELQPSPVRRGFGAKRQNGKPPAVPSAPGPSWRSRNATPNTYTPPSDSPGHRAASFSLFGSIAGLFKSSSPTKRQDDTSPRHQREGSGGGGIFGSPGKKGATPAGNAWQSRTDRNLMKAKADASSGDEASPTRGGPIDGSPSRRNTLKRGGSLKRGAAVGGPSRSPSARPRSKQVNLTDGEDEPIDRSAKRLSRHSSDGALGAFSLDRSGRSDIRGLDPGTPHQRHLLVKKSKESLKEKQKEQSPVRPKAEEPVAKPAGPPGGSPPANGPAKAPGQRRKIRKKSPRSGKAFADGLGSAGGALVIGGPNVPPKDDFSTGNDGRPMSPLLGAHVARSNTAKSTSDEPTGLSRGMPWSSSPKPQRRSSLQYEVLPESARTKADPVLNRLAHGRSLSNGGAESRGKNGPGPSIPYRSPTSLMSIVERGSNKPLPLPVARTNSPAQLETVKAPPSVLDRAPQVQSSPVAKTTPLPPTPAVGMGDSSSSGSDVFKSSAYHSAPHLVLPSDVKRPESPSGTRGRADQGQPPLEQNPRPFSPPMGSTPGARVIPAQDRSVETVKQSPTKSNPTPSALMPAPLRSALRNRSPSPMLPPQPTAGPSNHSRALEVTDKAGPVPTPFLAGALATKTNTLPALPPTTAPDQDGDDGDSASISSYETGRESVEERKGTIPAGAFKSLPAHPSPLHGILLHSLENGERKGTDLSMSLSSDSTTQQPTRKKSVRMALPPSQSSTPAVSPDARNEEPGRSEWSSSKPERRVSLDRPRRAEPARPSRITEVEEKPAHTGWSDSSDEDEDYGRAKRALDRANRAFAHAGDLPQKKFS